ncbi:MAG TPA: hypothetical protein VF667_10345 [Pseudonocardia sp.]
MSFLDLGPAGARRQRDVVAVLGRRRVRTALETGEVITPWAGVLVDPARATEPVTLMTAARLATGPLSVVTGPSAAFLHGLTSAAPTPVHLLLPYETRVQRRPGIVVHNGSNIDTDREDRDGLPVLSLDRVVSDLACTMYPPDALAVLDEAFAQLDELDRPAFRRRLRERLQVRPDPRGTVVGRRLVDLATGRAESPSESRLLWRVVDLGFPVPEVNLPVRDLGGRLLYRLDLGWSKVLIAIEYDGYAAHVGREEHDEARIRDLTRRGWIVIVVGVEDLANPVRLESELYAAFARRGVDLRARVVGTLRPRRHREPRRIRS